MKVSPWKMEKTYGRYKEVCPQVAAAHEQEARTKEPFLKVSAGGERLA